MQLVRLELDGQPRWVVRTADSGSLLAVSLDDLLQVSLDEARTAVESAVPAADLGGALLAPIQSQEVWAAGVTYERSRDGRIAESTEADVYERVYQAQRPEVFFKAPAQRVVADGEPVGVRADSPWNAPEPELGLVLNAAGEVFGYVPANDVSSRDHRRGEPALPAPGQGLRAVLLTGARDRSGLGGPGAALPDRDARRARGRIAFEGSTSTASITRGFEDLSAWLMAALDFPVGAILLTGTGIVPDESFSLQAGDRVTVDIEGIGVLTNPVVQVGRNLG